MGGTRYTTSGDRRKRMQNLGKKSCQAGGAASLGWVRPSSALRADLPLKHLCTVAGELQSSHQYQAGALLRCNQISSVHLPLLWSAAAGMQLEESQRACTSLLSTETTAKPQPWNLRAHFPSVPTDVRTSNSPIPLSTQTFTQAFPDPMPSLKISN